MARRGFLDYVLGGAVGGLEGLAQKRAAEEERKRMEEAATRQRMLDTVSLLNAGYDPEGFSQDMPGATPRPAFDTQMVGGRKFTRSMSPRQMKHMEDVQDEQAKTRSKRLDASLQVPKVPTPRALRYTPGEMGQDVYDPDAGTSTYQPYAKGFTPKKPTERAGKAEPSDAEKRRLGNQYLASQARNPALMAALQTTFANEPELAEDPALLAYDIMQSKVITKLGAGKGYTPPKSSVSASDKVDQDIRNAVAARAAAKAKGATPVTPVTPSPAPQAPTPAPATSSDAAYKQSQRAGLWESIKASNPTLSDDEITAQVMRRIP